MNITYNQQPPIYEASYGDEEIFSTDIKLYQLSVNTYHLIVVQESIENKFPEVSSVYDITLCYELVNKKLIYEYVNDGEDCSLYSNVKKTELHIKTDALVPPRDLFTIE